MSDEASGVTLTMRLIRSFTHRNIKHCVCRDIDLQQSGAQFLCDLLEGLPKRTDLPPPFKKFEYDAMKIEYKAHGAKTSDPVINTENDKELMIDLNKSLTENGIGHETEISVFRLADYEEYQKHPGEISW